MLIPEDDSVRLLSHILEGLNYTKLYKAYSSTGRKPTVDPKTMFKVITYAYSNNIYSSSEDCSNCTCKNKCTKAQGNRRIQVSKTFVQKRRRSYENILTEKCILLRVNRSIQVEGAFGVLKSDYNFSRFLTRGKNSVKTEFILLCFGYNINKLLMCLLKCAQIPQN